uniref:Fibronectin type-III domain-containing protein n=1 Tax=Magallana gigas TaxID=29159 RepID=A0A8W8KRM8_MAGGI|nr:twitchin isoform X1 [Crassostrea gigas]XP_034300669.1 twitchin isoform X1 [Crassostrea gigas]XP_034300670.1 twitchin isoform X1 [Crassostrea gigas]XP_034300671.1 twitchin isoform X1 [Crassostrea gigas]XP_034300672.1 twitchin isoform X1 [Crassostrea gigas]XP_034300673.1 twitchin isoform X1 [Crassostrea gigas]XP_034300674.1 twitchin isoform X1 [Crassostrea gigas]XP_034300675.1 twitchin isoform X1 [Crassostrea gigas]
MDDNTTKYSPKDLIDYLFRVSAVNEEGQVSPLETKEPVRLKRKIDVLSSPRQVKVSKLGPDFVTLDWKSLSSDGGSKVTGYVVKQKRGSDGDWEEVATLKAIETSYKVPKLDEDQEYFFSITALNQNGQGETCELDTSVVPKRPPDCLEMVFGTGDKEDPPSKELKKQRGFKRISGKRKPNEQQLRKQQLRGKWASF